MSVQSILKVERLTKTYPTAAGPLTVLHEVSFALAAGGTCAIVGPSGSGKTTLLGLCAGLDQPTTGTVELAGRQIGGLDEDGRARVRNEAVGFVFQNFQLIPTLTALENVMLPMDLCGTFTAKTRPTRAMELLASFFSWSWASQALIARGSASAKSPMPSRERNARKSARSVA